MGEVLGSDVEAADRLSHLMNESAQSFQDKAAVLTNQLASVRWNGEYADDFRRDWNTSARPRLADIGQMLGDAGTRLAAHVDAQRRVSDGEAAPARGATAGPRRVGGAATLHRHSRRR
jgi:hypothetical protein